MHYPYDIFISHNHADKELARRIAARLSSELFNGRPLRPWLDEQYLDPGELSTDTELTSALDWSRVLILIASSPAMRSTYVQLEVTHFLRTRTLNDVIILLSSSTPLTENLAKGSVVDFTQEADFSSAYHHLVEKICPATLTTNAEVRHVISAAFSNMLNNDPGSFDAQPNDARTSFFQELLKWDIEDAGEEGLAMEAFKCAAHGVMNLANSDERLYNVKMTLGECLAMARIRSHAYRQVMYALLEKQHDVLLFVVARAYSRLAEQNESLVDFGVLLRISLQVDLRNITGPQEKTIAAMVSRIAAKKRDTTIGELFIKTLSTMGTLSRWSAILAIAHDPRYSPSVSHIAPQEENAGYVSEKNVSLTRMPSKRLLSLLNDLNDSSDSFITSAIHNAKQELRRAHPNDELVYYMSWYGNKDRLHSVYAFNAPFMGRLTHATLKNMMTVQPAIDGSQLVYLSESRVLDALFYSAAGLVIPEQPLDSLLCKRLRSRNIPFCVIAAADLDKLNEGDYLAVHAEHVVHYPRAFYK